MPPPPDRLRKPKPAADGRPGARTLQLSLFDALDAAASLVQGEPAQAGGRRQACLNGQVVSWELRRARRRTIGFTIDGRGLRISAPRWVSLAEIDRAMVEKADWILRKLVEWREHAARRERLAPRWEDGAPLRLLGRTLVLRVDGQAAGVSVAEGELRVGLPPEAGAGHIEEQVHAWLQKRAREVFAERIPVFAQRLGRSPTRWGLSSARTRWGSCGPDGSIRLNWRLVHFPLEIVDYVIAHELAHLCEMNHGPRFWATVGRLFPDFRQARAWLRQYPEGAHAA
jgi:predicted metal-dependent hydrolase